MRKSGADVWRQKLPVPFFVFKWGAGMSPVLYGDMVIFLPGRRSQSSDLCLRSSDRANCAGRIDREDMAVNYSHPVICTVDGRDEIVVAGTGMLIGYDPSTGAPSLVCQRAVEEHQDHARLR